jgi:formylglycine-generating enzyme required for sulfatase activity
MKAENKIRVGLGTTLILLVFLTLALIDDVRKGSLLEASFGLLVICIFLVYLKGILTKDVQLTRRAFRTWFILSMISQGILLLCLLSLYSDHTIGSSGIVVGLLLIGLNLLVLYLLKTGIDGLMQHPDCKNKSAKVKVLWWAFLPLMIAAFLLLVFIFAPLLQFVQKSDSPTSGESREKASASGSTNTDRINLQPGKVMTNSIGMKFVFISPGTFQMGSYYGESDEKPIHTVKITKGYYMGIYEVTQEQYEKVIGTNHSLFKGAKLPVDNIFWDSAIEFCKKLSQMEGKTYRLPTEAEWEYACRAGTQSEYSFGDNVSLLDDYGWYDKNSNDKTHPVGKKKPNAWGLYDMHGNVWEWCQDWYDEQYYANSPTNNPQGPSSGEYHVLRGGGSNLDLADCRSAVRLGSSIYKFYSVGFRLILEK